MLSKQLGGSLARRLQLSTHPGVLALALAGGVLVGTLAPQWIEAVALPARLLLAVVQMSALPLLAVATAFGLRQVLALPRPGPRLLMALALGAALLVLGALSGTVLGVLLGLGSGLPADELAELGRWVQQRGGAAELVDMALWGEGGGGGAGAPALPHPAWPDNVFAALAGGNAAAVMLYTAAFALPFATLPRERTQALAAHLETVYRAFERLILMANRALPLLAFGMAAHLASQAGTHVLRLLGELLAALLVVALGLGAVALALLRRRTGATPGQLLSALRTPLLIALFGSTPVDTVPSLIEALSERLGLSRGVVELTVPTGAVFLGAGTAAHAALLAVFAAHLYGYPLQGTALLGVAAAAVAAALAMASAGTVGTVAGAALALGWLDLPPEAVLALALGVHAPCQALRNLLGLLAVVTLTAVMCGGLPSEQRQGAQDAPPSPPGPLHLAFTRGSAALAVASVALAGALALLAGVGVGLRQGSAAATPAPPGTTGTQEVRP